MPSVASCDCPGDCANRCPPATTDGASDERAAYRAASR